MYPGVGLHAASSWMFTMNFTMTFIFFIVCYNVFGSYKIIFKGFFCIFYIRACLCSEWWLNDFVLVLAAMFRSVIRFCLLIWYR